MPNEKLSSGCILRALAVLLLAPCAYAEPATAPDSGTSQQAPENRIQSLPQATRAEIEVAPLPRAFVGESAKVRPDGFSISGNTLVDTDALLDPLKELVGTETDTNAILTKLEDLQAIYRGRGYPATDVYLPQQSFPEVGGTIEIRVLEARIGEVRVEYTAGAGGSKSRSDGMAEQYLTSGAPVYLPEIERAVLLINDQAKTEARAELRPGKNQGETDVIIFVAPRESEREFEFTLGSDNYGVRSAGQYRLSAGITWSAPFDIGDRLSLRVLTAPEFLYGVDAGHRSNSLFRLNYDVPVSDWGTKLGINVAQSEYALGRQFEDLNANGIASTLSVSLVQPILRGRYSNLFGFVGYEYRVLEDQFDGSGLGKNEKNLHDYRVGVLANRTDPTAGRFGRGTTSMSLTATRGRLRFRNPLERAEDQAPTGAHAEGQFTKVNFELQHVQRFDEDSVDSLLLSARGQTALDNLTSAEKVDFAGPNGVRSHPIGSAVGDRGVLFSSEYRHRFSFDSDLLSQVTARLFVDHAWVNTNKQVTDNVLLASGNDADNRYTLTAAGIGLTLGAASRYRYQFDADVAWRVSGQRPDLPSGAKRGSGRAIPDEDLRSPMIYASFSMSF